jgi:glutamate synthase domain-containing protein 1/glutamate synthase domain-containing protein 3
MCEAISKILKSRPPYPFLLKKQESEGGCGVIGVACAEKIAAIHLLPSLCQMKNRGNGKGGGIAAAGLEAEYFGTTPAILENDYLLTLAYLDPKIRNVVETESIFPLFDIDHTYTMPASTDVPSVICYFVRVKQKAVEAFRREHDLPTLSQTTIEDELVYQNSFTLNQTFYASVGDKQAFVLSHGKNLIVLKCVGYADDVIHQYQLKPVKAHLWIGHHRYPTKGRVWHPGGAHPFIGLHEALVHNGDFANYYALCEYLAQRNIHPLFLTDTEVAALLFDLLSRTYQYPLEYIMEALAPTTERDFYHLPQEKQILYNLIQNTHLHASPDGPWFFLIAQSHARYFRLIGITDTSMLRPQVFALQSSEAPLGLIASEKQAIDALLRSLSQSDSRFWPRADHYWSCRGGSYTDGGAFSFTVTPQSHGSAILTCTDKFGKYFGAPLPTPPGKWKKAAFTHIPHTFSDSSHTLHDDLASQVDLYAWAKRELQTWREEQARAFLLAFKESAMTEDSTERVFSVLTSLLDHIYPMHNLRRSFWQALVEAALGELITALNGCNSHERYILDARCYPIDGENSLARTLIKAYQAGHRKFIIGNCAGHRFIGSGLGPHSQEVDIDIYGSPGDYLASGLDGAVIRVHGNAQDQTAQIFKEGKLVIFGGVGQTLLYGAKGGVTFVRGSTAGRPLINAAGKAKLIINGTALDYCAESFMAGDPLEGGGFAVINRIYFNNEGELVDIHPPYPGSNLFSLASGGAIYIRDPDHEVGEDQLNEGIFTSMTLRDEQLLIPYLEENAQLFDIPLVRLLQKNHHTLPFQQVYRKIIPARTHHLDPETAWITNPRFRGG